MHDQLGLEQLQGLIKHVCPAIIRKMLDSFNYVSSGFTFRAGVCFSLLIPIIFHIRTPHNPILKLRRRNRITYFDHDDSGQPVETPRWVAMRSVRARVDDLPTKDDPEQTHALKKRSNLSANDGPKVIGDLAMIEEPLAATF
jgi:hypothetical protein